MRRACTLVAAFLSTAALAADPPALPGPGPKQTTFSSPSNDYVIILTSRSVQKELGLKPEAAKAVVDFGYDVSKRSLAASKDLRTKVTDVKERIAKRAEIREKFDKEYHDGLAKHLDAKQLKRLGEIRLQAEAPASLTWPAADAKLMLSDDQKGTLARINRDLVADRLNVMMKAAPDARDPAKRAELDQKLLALTAKYTADALALLDDRQKKAWKELTGEPFDLGKLGIGIVDKE